MQAWFAGIPVYGNILTAVYPPASYAILWPFLGWLAILPARWLWAVTTIASLVWLVRLTVCESGVDTHLQRVFVALIPLSMYATGATIGNGQLTVHLLPVIVSGLLMISRNGHKLRVGLIPAIMILMALVKPTITAPFF